MARQHTGTAVGIISEGHKEVVISEQQVQRKNAQPPTVGDVESWRTTKFFD